jgi:tRNA pseudouridine38-40 synthase
MSRYRAIVEYDGTEFLGFQLQAQGRTVQGELERAIADVTRSSVRVTGAGRTDAGVHATGQVVAFDVYWRHSVEDLQRALNAVLAEDVAVRKLEITRHDFHPRFDAAARSYEYVVVTADVRRPLLRRYAHLERRALSIEAMQSACEHLVGCQDFAAFGKPPQGDNTVRCVHSAIWRMGSRNRYVFEIVANAFLYRMVRNIVGTLLRVGRREISPEHVRELLDSRDRNAAGPPAPARGLCLTRVYYANDGLWQE